MRAATKMGGVPHTHNSYAHLFRNAYRLINCSGAHNEPHASIAIHTHATRCQPLAQNLWVRVHHASPKTVSVNTDPLNSMATLRPEIRFYETV